MMVDCKKCLEGASTNILNLLISNLDLIYQALMLKSMVFFLFTRNAKITSVLSEDYTSASMARGSKFWFLLETDRNLLASCNLYTCQNWQLFVTSISISFISILIFWLIFFFSLIYCFFFFHKYLFFFHVHPLPSCQIFLLLMRVSSLESELESCIFHKCQCFIRRKMCLAEFQMMMLECKKHFERASAKILNLLISNLELINVAFLSKSMHPCIFQKCLCFIHGKMC